MASPQKKTMGRVKIEPASAGFNSLLSAKRDLGSRLSSFKPPRDLSLSSVSSPLNLKSMTNPLVARRNVFVPNVNVTRKKGQSASVGNQANAVTDVKPNLERKRPAKSRGNFVQTQGVFSEGQSQSEKPRGFSQRASSESSPAPQIEKPKLNLNKLIDKKEEDGKMKEILRDDFIDDPSILPNLRNCPMALPLLLNSKVNCLDLESTFDSLQVKSEKIDLDGSDYGRSSKVMKLFDDSPMPKLLLFEFPNEIISKEVDTKPSKDVKQEKGSKSVPVVKQEPGSRLSNLGEGQWGSLRILQDGSAYISVGNEIVPLDVTRHCPRQNVVSLSSAENDARGMFVNLGSIAGNLTCSTEMSFPSSSLK